MYNVCKKLFLQPINDENFYDLCISFYNVCAIIDCKYQMSHTDTRLVP